MDDNQKSRLMVIGFAGMLLLGGGGWWIYTQNNAAEKLENEAGIPQQPGSPAAPPANQTAANPPDNQAVGSTTPATTPPATPPVQPTPATPAQTAANPPAQTTPANPPAQTAANPPVKPPVQTVATPVVKPVQTATTPPAQTTPAKPSVPPPQVASKPVTAPPVTQPPAKTPPPAPVVASKPLVTAPVKTPPPAPVVASKPAAAPPGQSAIPPAMPPKPPAPPVIANLPPQPPQVTAPQSDRFPATKREEARSAAKQVAGRQDPCQGTFDKTPYPAPWTKVGQAPGARTTAVDEKEEKDKADKNKPQVASADGSKVLPPPPPPTREKPVPPPPPSNIGPSNIGSGGDIPVDQLPVAPEKPMVSNKLTLTAILGNRAVLAVPMTMRAQNKWPAQICLGPGEKFEDPEHGSFSVVSVDQDSVTIEEEQERSVKSLPQIK